MNPTRARGSACVVAREQGEFHDLWRPRDALAVARLTLESGGERREVKVAGPLTVGRAPTAGVYLDDKTLSREHSQFYLDHGRICVRDLESKNGTLVNGQRITRPTSLSPGDQVKIGVAVFTVVHEAGDPLPAISAPAPQRASAPHAPAPKQHAPNLNRVLTTGPGAAAIFFYRIILLGVILVGAYLSKPVFRWLLERIPS